MKAVLRSRGNFYFTKEYKKPTCGSKDILVKVKAAAINPVDYKLGWPILGEVVGFDFAGVIEEKGASVVEDFKVGDEVYGSAGRSGSLAEYTAVYPSMIARKPQSLTFTEAASMNIAYLTSLQGLRDYGKLQSGDRVLVIGASGGCGTAAVQLAKALGASEIVGVCSGKNSDLVKSLGATEVIDYTQQTVKQFYQDEEGKVPEDKKFDVVYDAATNSGGGEDYKDSSMELLKSEGDRHGQYVAINGYVGMWLRRMTIGMRANENLVIVRYNSSDLEYLGKLVDENGIKPVIREELAFNEENMGKGFALLKSRRAVGKIVFNMDAGDE